MQEILRVIGMSKSYKQMQVLDNIQMTINKGDIYGFVGENGSGKSTTIRMITGLGTPTHGEIRAFGKALSESTEDAQQKMGLLLEGPSLILNMTARQNLEAHRLLIGIPDKKRIDRVLELVNLTHTGKKKVKNFSLGMKQRLGIALALLNEPELLILDEPTNGLDPMGIVSLRKLLQTLNDEEGMTILISSHILSELELLATKFGFIHKGRLIQEISATDIKAKARRYLEIEVDNLELAVRTIRETLGTEDFQVDGNETIRLFELVDEKQFVSRTLTDSGVILEKFVQKSDTLEQYFTNLVGGGK